MDVIKARTLAAGAAACLVAFGGCRPAAPASEPTIVTETTAARCPRSEAAHRLTLGRWECEEGIFLDGGPEEGESRLLRRADSVGGDAVPLCPYTDCTHSGESCGARLNGHGRDSVLFLTDGFLYVLDDHELLRMRPDGSARAVAAAVPSMAGLKSAWLYRDRLYLHGGMLNDIQVPQKQGPPVHDVVPVSGVVEIDYRGGNGREVVRLDTCGSDDALCGIEDGLLYLFSKYDYPAGSRETDSGLNGGTADLFTVEIDRGRRSDIYRDKTVGLDEVVADGAGHLYFHSRREATVYRLDMRSGEKTALLAGTGGRVHLRGVMDGHLLLEVMRDGGDPEARACRLSDGRITVLPFRTRITGPGQSGRSLPARQLYQRENWIYFIREQECGGDARPARVRMARIERAKFLAGDAEGVELQDWQPYGQWRTAWQACSALLPHTRDV